MRTNKDNTYNKYRFTIEEPRRHLNDLFIGEFWASRFDLIGVYNVL